MCRGLVISERYQMSTAMEVTGVRERLVREWFAKVQDVDIMMVIDQDRLASLLGERIMRNRTKRTEFAHGTIRARAVNVPPRPAARSKPTAEPALPVDRSAVPTKLSVAQLLTAAGYNVDDVMRLMAESVLDKATAWPTSRG